MIIEVARYISLFSLAAYLILVLRYELHMMQLNSYYGLRYFRWLKENYTFAYDAAKLLTILVGSLAYLLGSLEAMIALVGVSVWGVVRLARRKQKKKLDYTFRASLLFATEIAVVVILVIGAYSLADSIQYGAVAIVFAFALSPVVVVMSNVLILPVMSKINNWYIHDARKKLNNLSGVVRIGITGSYGKTSTKHFLHRILSEKYNVLMTPGSYNTTLGVVRTIREQLRPTHEVFLVEIGAKKTGDVREICDIVKPQYGIVTAIGSQHLETFGSLEKIRNEKLELVSCLPQDGAAFIGLDSTIAGGVSETTKARVITYAIHPGADYIASNITYEKEGMSFDVESAEKRVLSVKTSLLGDHNVSNLLASCAVALELGIEAFRIEKAISEIESVPHRLEIKRLPKGITIIDDAFNANPVGSRMALDVLKRFRGDRKMIITPGMIELGVKEYELNFEFGSNIARACDLVFLVGDKRTRAIRDGILACGFPLKNIYVCDNLTEVNKKVKNIMKTGDVILYENDLPDNYNE